MIMGGGGVSGAPCHTSSESKLLDLTLENKGRVGGVETIRSISSSPSSPSISLSVHIQTSLRIKATAQVHEKYILPSFSPWSKLTSCWIGRKQLERAYRTIQSQPEKEGWCVLQKQASRVLNTQSKAKASDNASVDGQKSDTFKQKFRATRTSIHSAAPTRAIESQAACWKETIVMGHCTEVSIDMMMTNIFQHMKTKRDRKSVREKDRHTDCGMLDLLLL